MIYRSGVFSRKEGLDPDTFTSHWTKVHGALASRMPELHRYVQNHIDERLYEREPFPAHRIDGISQLWFDDVAAMERSEKSPEYAACKLDIPKFQGEITILVLDSVVVGGGASERPALLADKTATKLFWFANARSELGPDALRDQWRSQAPASGDGILCHIQSVVVDRAHPVSAGVPQGKLPADAFGEIWFADAKALRAWARSASGRRALHDNPLLDPLAIYAGHEVPIV